MATTESSLKTRFLTAARRVAVAMGLKLHHQCIEDSLSSGIPDINLCFDGVETWVEAKVLEAWPKRPTTGVRVAHFTAEQALWLELRAEAGGRAWLMLQVESETLFLSPSVARMLFRRELTQEALRQSADLICGRSFSQSDVERVLYYSI